MGRMSDIMVYFQLVPMCFHLIHMHFPSGLMMWKWC